MVLMRNSKIPQNKYFRWQRFKVDHVFIDGRDYFNGDQAN